MMMMTLLLLLLMMMMIQCRFDSELRVRCRICRMDRVQIASSHLYYYLVFFIKDKYQDKSRYSAHYSSY